MKIQCPLSCHLNQMLPSALLRVRTPLARSIVSAPNRVGSVRRQDRIVQAKVNDEGTESKGQQLWRKELQSSTELGLFDDEKLRNSEIEKDIQRLAEKEAAERVLNRPYDNTKDTKTEEQSVLLNAIEKILVADFFFILFILAWLVAGVAEQSFLDSTKLIDSWLPLWSSVFQPALGVFMAGAIVSAVGKKKDR